MSLEPHTVALCFQEGKRALLTEAVVMEAGVCTGVLSVQAAPEPSLSKAEDGTGIFVSTFYC